MHNQSIKTMHKLNNKQALELATQFAALTKPLIRFE